tara:strand:- start:128 stop:433 length:306 start_codon:yes stop_codon:yes gene_type:complete
MKQELDCPYYFTSRCTMGRCNCKPKQDSRKYPLTPDECFKQETLEDKLKSLVEQWHKRQEHYIDVAYKHVDNAHNNRKFTYKAMATRDCWKELLKLIEDEK